MRTVPFPRPRHAVAGLLLLTLVAVVACAPPPPTDRAAPAPPSVPEADRTPVATHGFGRPVALVELDRSGDAKVAVAAGADGPLALYEDGRGVVARPLVGDTTPRRLHETRGVRGLFGGEADGDPIVAWAERDLSTGDTALRTAWRDEVRTVATFAGTPRVRVVSGAARPEVVTATSETGVWSIDLHRANDAPLRLARRDREVAGVDALRHDGVLHVAWLEGRTEVTLGRAEADWSAFHLTVPAGATAGATPERLGGALRVRDLDVARLGVGADGRVETAWPTERGLVAAAGPAVTPRPLGTGVAIGRPEGRWTWIDEVRLMQERDGAPVPVVRLPAAPEHATGTSADGVTGVVFSSGRYLGGVTVWAVSDADPYEPSWAERLAVRVGWDPWRPATEAGGHLAVASLAALLLAVAAAPFWWIVAALLGRRGVGGGRRVWIDGGLLGAGSILVAVIAFVQFAAFAPGDARALVGGPAVWTVASVAGLAAARILVAGRDTEATMGRLLAAFAAGGTSAWLIAMYSAQPWLRLLSAAS